MMIEASRNMAMVDSPEAPQISVLRLPGGIVKIKLLMAMFNVSLRDICNGAGRSISRSQLHRVLHGQSATPCERRAIAMGLCECLRVRCDSAYFFGD